MTALADAGTYKKEYNDGTRTITYVFGRNTTGTGGPYAFNPETNPTP